MAGMTIGGVLGTSVYPESDTIDGIVDLKASRGGPDHISMVACGLAVAVFHLADAGYGL